MSESTPATRSTDDAEQHQPLYERLKHDIVVGVFPAGAPLVETQLADRYAVSRTPVRDALRQLEHEGQIERVGRSMRVRYISPEEIYELYEVRAILEGAATRAAAERQTPFDVAQLRSLLERLESQDVDVAERVRLNRMFHSAIWQASHNSVLIDVLDRLYDTSVGHMSTTLAASDRWAESLREHREMVSAIVAGDGETAAQLVVKHLETARDIRLQRAIAPS